MPAVCVCVCVHSVKDGDRKRVTMCVCVHMDVCVYV